VLIDLIELIVLDIVVFYPTTILKMVVIESEIVEDKIVVY